MDNNREKIMEALNPLGAVVFEIAAFGLTANSKWFKGLSPKKKLACTVIVLFYFISTVAAAVFAYCNQWQQRMRAGLKMKFFIQTLVCGAIIFLTYEFGEHHSDYYLLAAFVCAAFHFHLGAHSFRYLEDYGLAQGLITVAVTAGMHLAKEWPMLIVPGLAGAILSALYNLILNREANNEGDERARDRIRELEEGVVDQIRGLEENVTRLRDELLLARRAQVQDTSVLREANNEEDKNARDQCASDMEIKRLEEVIRAHEQTIIEMQGQLQGLPGPSYSETHSQRSQGKSDDDLEPLLEQDNERARVGHGDDTNSAHNNISLRLRKKYEEKEETPTPERYYYGGYSGYDEELERMEREYKEEEAEGKAKIP